MLLKGALQPQPIYQYVLEIEVGPEG